MTTTDAPVERVVVTGLGATTPLGGDVTSTWNAMLRGDSGVRELDEPWTKEVPIPLGALVLVEPGPVLSALQRRRLDRCGQLAVAAAQEAWSDAGLDDVPIARHRLGVAMACAMGGITSLINGYEMWKARGWSRIHPLAIPMTMANGPAAAVGLSLGARAGVHAGVSACASGTYALATAVDTIRSGRADMVLAGGAEAPVHPVVLSGFASMRALSRRLDEPAAASRPYDAQRDGLVLAEGAGALVLEAEAHARQRGARIYAVLEGVGVSSDAYHMVQPEPGGVASAMAMRASLADAGVDATQVAHVNANASSTVPGDAAEARAMAAVFGPTAGPAVSANKSMTGHALGAAGAIESIATVLSVYHGVVPATINFERTDDGLVLDVVHGTARKLEGDDLVALKNSAGFGGHNVALTFREAGAAVPG